MTNSPIVRIWDIWVRLFHWSLAFSVLFLLFSGETGVGFYDWHRLVGEFVLLLLAFRLCWGFFGSSNASLLSLFKSPVAAFSHLKSLLSGDVRAERGHNAAGGWAVLALLLLCSVQALTGLFIADEDELIEGVFYGTFGSDTSNWLYSIHHTNAELLQILVAVHVLMVFFYLFRAGQNLIKPMITGRMLWQGSTAAPEVQFAKPVLGLVFLAVCYLLLAYLFQWSPLF